MNRAVLTAALLAAAVLGGCGGDSGGDGAGVGVSLELRHTEPLQSNAPVRWTLVLRNDRPNRLAIRFLSGKDGDVALRQDGEERYRWSHDRVFITAVRDLQVGANETRTFAFEDTLTVPAGEYELTATLATDRQVPPVTSLVTVSG